MRWTPGGDRSNIEDRRGQGGGFGGGVAPSGQAAPGTGAPVQESAAEANLREFVTFVLNDAQETWKRILPQTENTQYHDAKLVLFRDATETACGVGQSAMGPFYCPL